MTETPGETPVERRLREMAHCPYCTNGYTSPGLPCVICEQRITADESAAIDAGREAIVMLREWLSSDFYGHHTGELRKRSSALLARCEETR